MSWATLFLAVIIFGFGLTLTVKYGPGALLIAALWLLLQSAVISQGCLP